MTLRYATLASPTLRTAYDQAIGKVRKALPIAPTGQPIVPAKIDWIASEFLKTRVAHGYCSWQGEVDVGVRVCLKMRREFSFELARLRRVLRILPQLPPQLGDLGLELRDPLGLNSDESGKLLVRGARIIRHHFMVRGQPRTSTRHACQTTTNTKVTSVTRDAWHLTSYLSRSRSNRK